MNLSAKILSLLFAAAALPAIAQQTIPWNEAYRLADEKISQLTLDEKIAFTRGYESFFFYGVPEKGIPHLYLSDATQGVHIRRDLSKNLVRQLDRSTAFPCPLALAATFNPQLAHAYAKAIGEECRAGGIEILLGPGMNIYRNAQNGRNFEYLGEDPELAAQLVAEYVQGMQSTGTAACLKHFIGNETEFYRRRSNSIVDDRALHEIYLPPFKAGIDAGAACVMTSYNRLNGEWTGQSNRVIKGLLRDTLGFHGCVMSDWRSVYDTEKTVRSGQNVEMPGRKETIREIRDLLARGRISEQDIDEMIRPTIAMGIAFGLYNREKYRTDLLTEFPRHNQVCYDVAAEGIVLLRNNGILPLDPDGKERILVVGNNLHLIPRGLGAAAVTGYDNKTLPEALKDSFGERIMVSEHPTEQELKEADIVIVNLTTADAESFERPFALPESEEKLALRATKANPHTVVIVNSGSGVRMTDWNDRCAALIYGWYPGQNGFPALADMLTGKVNPSGKLPITLEREFADSPAEGTMPAGAEFYNKAPRAYNEALIGLYDVHYDESVLVGYRWYESRGIKPLYPFGFGLSYTTFELSKARAPKIFPREGPLRVSVTLTNTGKREGCEVVQLYVSEDNPTVLRPRKELRAFRKVSAAPRKSEVVTLEIDRRDLAFWDTGSNNWKVNPGNYTLSLGTSSADIAITLPVTVR